TCARRATKTRLLFDREIIILPSGETALELHDGKAVSGELHRRFRSEVADLGVAIEDIEFVLLQSFGGRPASLRQVFCTGNMAFLVIFSRADIDDVDLVTVQFAL